MLILEPQPKVVTFDCYGTLVQWHRALDAAVRRILAEETGVDDVERGRVDEIVDALRTSSMERQARPPYRDYKTILRESLGHVLRAKGLATGADHGDLLLASIRDIPPHPDVQEALERLRTRFRLAIISNTDDDLIARTVESIGVPFDFVITAQQAQAYKPDHRLFLHAHAVMGVARSETIHVGMGQVTDLQVCHELGIRAVWIDRLGETLNPRWVPAAVLPDLSGLPDVLGVPLSSR